MSWGCDYGLERESTPSWGTIPLRTLKEGSLPLQSVGAHASAIKNHATRRPGRVDSLKRSIRPQKYSKRLPKASKHSPNVFRVLVTVCGINKGQCADSHKCEPKVGPVQLCGAFDGASCIETRGLKFWGPDFLVGCGYAR